MNLEKQTISIFEAAYNRLTPFHSMIKSRPAIIAYSGGKDSTLLCHFYSYLFQQSKSPEPTLFHLNHLIRDNASQEIEIELEMQKFSNQTITKKKTFQNSPNS